MSDAITSSPISSSVAVTAAGDCTCWTSPGRRVPFPRSSAAANASNVCSVKLLPLPDRPAPSGLGILAHMGVRIHTLAKATRLGDDGPPVAGMRETKIRFGVRAWQLIQEEARHDGVSASQFVRESAIVRATYLRTLRGDTEIGEALQEIVKSLHINDGGS